MQNDDILTALSVIYNVARDLDQKGHGAASICATTYSTEELIKYNILNLLSYLCSCSNEKELDIDVISDITGLPITYSACVDAAVTNNIDSSVLSNLPLSFVVMVNADQKNGVSLLEEGAEENSCAYTLFLIYQLILTRFYKNCTVDELKAKNESLYNFLLGLSSYIYDNLKTIMSYYNPASGTIDAPKFRIDPKTGEIMINPAAGTNKKSQTKHSPGCRPSVPTGARSVPTGARSAPTGARTGANNSRTRSGRSHKQSSGLAGIFDFLKKIFHFN